ncbi:MAG: hypothetical protein O3A51_05380 [Verrucomicrobia bacterium]|nr:hypothetical protein [Verrucomicrobiota bacterium]
MRIRTQAIINEIEDSIRSLRTAPRDDKGQIRDRLTLAKIQRLEREKAWLQAHGSRLASRRHRHVVA